MDYLWFVLKGVPFYREHNYTFEIPDHPKFQRLAQISPNFEVTDRDAAEKLFVEQIYNPDFFKPGLAALESERPRIESAFPNMIDFNRKWGFKIFSQYQLLLTRYGPGGMSYNDTGIIVARVNESGSLRRKHPSHTPVHEMVEIGISDLIPKFELTHAEKERVVDHICITRLGNSVPGYKFQTDDPDLAPVGDKRIDSFFSQGTLDNLPEILNQYVLKFPRK